MNARTDYIVDNTTNCLLLLSAAHGPLYVQTTNGGKTFTLLSNMRNATESGFSAISIMPSTIRISQNHVITAVRHLAGEPNVSWVDVLASNDNGKTWTFLSKVADADRRYWNGTPMVRLRDGRLCVTYGYRAFPYGIRAKISADNGKTWRSELILRADGRNWDLGYSRTVQRPDGKLVAIYYYSTDEQPEQHIAATIWDPSLIDTLSSKRQACDNIRDQIHVIDTSIQQISKLTAQKIRSVNPIICWTQEKENPADRLIRETQLLLAEQAKSTATTHPERYKQHLPEMTTLLQLQFYSCQAKRTNAASNIKKLPSLQTSLCEICAASP